MTALLALGAFALAFVAFLCRPHLAKVVDAFHDDPAVLSSDDALTAALDLAARFRPSGLESKAGLEANLAAIDAAEAQPLPLRCRRLRRARAVWLDRYRRATLWEIHERVVYEAQKERIKALGL